jgi:large subunit ribosomal protein L8e
VLTSRAPWCRLGRIIRGQRKGRGSIFVSHTKHRKGATKLRPLDYAEKNGYVRGVVKDLIHDPGRGAPIVKVQFNNPYRYKKDTYQWTATEGTYTGQFIYCGKKGALPCPDAARCPAATPAHRRREVRCGGANELCMS